MATNEVVKFDKDFLLGTGSSAYQVEGAYEADDKSPSIWDEFVNKGQQVQEDICNCLHYGVPKNSNRSVLYTPKPKIVVEDFYKGFFRTKREKPPGMMMANEPTTSKMENGNIACDSYNKTDIDIQLLKDLGVQVYRFSLSWPRLLPKGDDQEHNEKGINYYKNLIQKLRDANIEPMVTIYHWDLPVALQKLGGWANKNIIRYFVNYCDFVFKTFGDKVKYWSTINEPRLIASAYGGQKSAPALGTEYSGIVDYMVVHNLLLAHAYAYQMYNKKHRANQQGQISICLDAIWFFPNNPNDKEDEKAAEVAFQSFVGIFVEPLLTGEYPDEVVKSVIKMNEQENKNVWRIINFTENEKEVLKDSYDFIAFNYYFSWYAKAMSQEFIENKKIELIKKDYGAEILINPDFAEQNATREGFKNLLNWFHDKLNHPKIFICENGLADKSNDDRSLEKKQFHYDMLIEVDQAIKRKINVIGYCVWSFMDSFEWSLGYEPKYGIYRVDFDDEKRPRYKKEKIFKFFEQLFKTKTLPQPEIE